MQIFNIGETVIDTRTHECAIVVAIIPRSQNSMIDIYILDKDGKFYMSDDTHLVAYDEYYWDDTD